MCHQLQWAIQYLTIESTDDDKVIQCEGMINGNPPVMASDSITLDVTGE